MTSLLFVIEEDSSLVTFTSVSEYYATLYVDSIILKVNAADGEKLFQLITFLTVIENYYDEGT